MWSRLFLRAHVSLSTASPSIPSLRCVLCVTLSQGTLNNVPQAGTIFPGLWRRDSWLAAAVQVSWQLELQEADWARDLYQWECAA